MQKSEAEEKKEVSEEREETKGQEEEYKGDSRVIEKADEVKKDKREEGAAKEIRENGYERKRIMRSEKIIGTRRMEIRENRDRSGDR